MIIDELNALPEPERQWGWMYGHGGFSGGQIRYGELMTHREYMDKYEPEVQAIGLDSLMRSKIAGLLQNHFCKYFAPVGRYMNERGVVELVCSGEKGYALFKDDTPSDRLIYVQCCVWLEPIYASPMYPIVEFRALFCDLRDPSATSWSGVLAELEMSALPALRKALLAASYHHHQIAQIHEGCAKAIKYQGERFCDSFQQQEGVAGKE